MQGHTGVLAGTEVEGHACHVEPLQVAGPVRSPLGSHKPERALRGGSGRSPVPGRAQRLRARAGRLGPRTCGPSERSCSAATEHLPVAGSTVAGPAAGARTPAKSAESEALGAGLPQAVRLEAPRATGRPNARVTDMSGGSHHRLPGSRLCPGGPWETPRPGRLRGAEHVW